MSYRNMLGLLLLAAMAACQDTGPLQPTDTSSTAAQAGPHLVAFASTRDGNSEIYTMDAAGTDATGKAAPVRLTNNPGVDGAPDISPDGRTIVFHSVRPEHANSEIYIMNLDGSSQQRLTNSTSSSFFPAFSPDGRHIAFARGTAPVGTTRGTRQIWVMNVDGTEPHQYTSFADNYRPRWSPDGRLIIFASDLDGDFANATAREKGANFGLHDIYTIGADGVGITRLTAVRTSLNGEPVYSPDGRQIAFRSRRNRDKNGDNYCAISTMNADGSDVRNLTPIPAELTWDQWCNAFPVWSQNGKQILFHALRPTTDFGTQLEIYALDVQSGVLSRLTSHAAADQAPAIR